MNGSQNQLRILGGQQFIYSGNEAYRNKIDQL